MPRRPRLQKRRRAKCPPRASRFRQRPSPSRSNARNRRPEFGGLSPTRRVIGDRPQGYRGNRLATVRIYKVAELLNTTSQEVMALLKRDHGIDVKSASSTIEEVVGRQFVDRLARQRGITLPGGDIFAEGAAAKAPVRKPMLAKKAGPEPAKPAAPVLGPPRLNKAAKALH